MGDIKYYQLLKGEEMPDEFCVVRDVNGEPSEYMFYVPEAENVKLRELARDMLTCIEHACLCDFCPLFVAEEDIDEARCIADMDSRMRELEVKQ